MSFTKSNDLAYATNKFLDGYIPTHPILVAGEKTVIVYVHGGGFRAGNEENKVAKDFCEYMASSGYYSYSIRYTLDGTIPSAVADVELAMDWIVQQGGVSKIFLAGDSAGAITVLNIGAKNNSHVRGVIAVSGALYDNLSLLSKSTPPIMLWHGTLDTIIPSTYADAIVQRNKELGRNTMIYKHAANHAQTPYSTTCDGGTLFSKSLDFITTPPPQVEVQQPFPCLPPSIIDALFALCPMCRTRF